MNTAKIYRDLEGNERTIYQMVKHEPEWAANRIQAGEDALNSLQQLKAEIRLLLTEIEYDERGVGQITKGAIARKLRELSAV